MRLTVLLIMLSIVPNAFAAAILAPGDTILGGQSNGTVFTVGVVGFDAGVNNWPGSEGPEHLIDGVGQKYLNFGETNTGAIITPSFGSSVLDSIQFWTANDAEPRDPSGYQLFGTNVALTGTTFNLSDFNLISAGGLALPSTRNPGGGSPLVDANSQTVSFSNSAAYTSYLLLFPDVKDSANANSMQIAEAQFFGVAPDSQVPTPATLALLGLGLVGMCFKKNKA